VNTNPVSAHLTADQTKAPPGLEITFDATGSTLGNGTGQYLFDFGDGTRTDWRLDPVIAHSYDKEGEYIVRVTVKGEGGAMSTNDASVTVVITTEGMLATAIIETIVPDPSHLGDMVTLTGRGTPIRGTTIRNYSWTSSIGGAVGDTAIVRLSTLSRGTHNISFRVQDSRDIWSDPVTRELEVLPPMTAWKVEIQKPHDGAKLGGPMLKVEGTAVFSDIPIEKVKVRIDEGEWTIAQGRSDWKIDMDILELKDGKHTLEVRAYTETSESGSVTITFTKGYSASSIGMLGELSDGKLILAFLATVVIVVAIVVTRRRHNPMIP
jgi:PKD repeat protein